MASGFVTENMPYQDFVDSASSSKVLTVIVKDEKVILVGLGIKTIGYEEHYNAFKIVLKPS